MRIRDRRPEDPAAFFVDPVYPDLREIQDGLPWERAAYWRRIEPAIEAWAARQVPPPNGWASAIGRGARVRALVEECRRRLRDRGHLIVEGTVYRLPGARPTSKKDETLQG